ncbi:hypothetical protein ONZ51_g8861 [Trametes cubensis]|uniref:54S ribosomal protein L20, mitochondrial n=1 Tax=Trametes cubensis TaxID=1111947 RepID=A0AAD7X8V9_9APHY|nr:hypothetical protein ONZ51_g8861 [Trametes cubensis]
MKPRMPFSLRLPSFARSYATRLPERPPYRAPDPLRNNPNATYQELSESDGPTPVTGALPPQVGKAREAHARLPDEAIAKMRDLRRADPATWTRGRLAKEFGCSPWFVGKIISLKGPDRRRALEAREKAHEAARAKWGERKSLQMDIRKKRKEFW